MNLIFHMQHDQTPGLQNHKTQLGREYKVATHTKIAKPIKSPEWFGIYLAEILCGELAGPWCIQ